MFEKRGLVSFKEFDNSEKSEKEKCETSGLISLRIQRCWTSGNAAKIMLKSLKNWPNWFLRVWKLI